MNRLAILIWLLIASPAAADTYTYTVNFGPWWTPEYRITGSVTTGCDDCSLYIPQSWTFTGTMNGESRTISSTDPDFRPVIQEIQPFTFTPQGMYFDFTYKGGNSDLCFCIWNVSPTQSNEGLVFMWDADYSVMTYFFMYGDFAFNIEGNGNMQLGTLTSSYIDPVPLPPALWLFGTGLVGLGLARRYSR